jgi:sporulation protein YlmC with PRC-barrel domain
VYFNVHDPPPTSGLTQHQCALYALGVFMFYSSLKGKKVYVMEDASYAGEVNGVYISKKTRKLTHLVLLNERNCILAYNRVFGFDKFITAKSKNSLFLDIANSNNYIFLNIGVTVIDATGEYLGILQDVSFNQNDQSAGFLKTDLHEIDLKNVVSSSPKITIVNMHKKVVLPRAKKLPKNSEIPPIKNKPKTDNLKQENFSQILTYTEIFKNDPNDEKIENCAPPCPKSRTHAPNDYSFLLGRKMQSDVFDLTKTFLVKAGTVLNHRIVTAAQRVGKLVDLAINSTRKNH